MGTFNEPCLSKAGIEKGLKEILGDKYEELVAKLISDNFIGWYSRSVATAMFLFARNKKGRWCVLANKRGPGCPDFVGCWCASCGYLNYDETTRECAVRELHEETGVVLSPSEIEYLCGIEDSPLANHQNVTFRYAKVCGKVFPKWVPCIVQKWLDPDSMKTEDFKTNRNHMEEDEVDEIKWIPLNELCEYEWAFGHDKTITEIAEKFKIA